MNPEVNFGVDGILSYDLFGKELWITTTHISILAIDIIIITLVVLVNIAIRKNDIKKTPGIFLNTIELVVQSLDNFTKANMGNVFSIPFSNYIGTIFLFILLSNISGIVGLRPPTADYGVPLALGVITFVMIQYNGFKQRKANHIKALFEPLPILFPINLIGEIAIPLSLSLRLFGNVMAGTVMLSLLYGLLPKALTLVWPAVLHFYFDLFSGGIQAYVFCMLTTVFISSRMQD